ncbi:MAG TPA: CPBP family intramembrane glutamic endopeptidase [Terriglobales bacterium]|nr:CPBP family intramembrane glutamic endopeptidase [Terriglobales bacterium]
MADLLIMVVLALPFVGLLCPGHSFAAQVGREGIYWLCTLALIGFIPMAEGRPFSSIGLLRPTWKTGVVGIVGAAAMVAGMATIYIVIFPILGVSANESMTASIKSMPLWFRTLLMLRAAVFEEVFYRGFMIERLTELTRLRWLAALLSLGAFTLAHVNGWGWAHLLIAGFGGIVLTTIYLIRKDLACNMLAHFLTDAVAFLLG